MVAVVVCFRRLSRKDGAERRACSGWCRTVTSYAFYLGSVWIIFLRRRRISRCPKREYGIPFLVFLLKDVPPICT